MLGDWTLLTTLLYITGIFLLLAEGVIPGFGVAGVSGIICVFVSVFMITSNLYEALLLLILTIAFMVLTLIVLYRFGFGSKYMKFLVLKTEQKNEEGYTTVDNIKKYLGKRGKTESALRPSGAVLIGDVRIDAVTQGEYIDKESIVEVIKVEGNTLIVKKVNKEGL